MFMLLDVVLICSAAMYLMLIGVVNQMLFIILLLLDSFTVFPMIPIYAANLI